MRALVLSTGTGQGHNTAGLALLDELRSRGHFCELLDPIALRSERASRLVGQAYIQTAVRAPALFGLLYRAGARISSPKRKSIVYLANTLYADELWEKIGRGRYDAAIAPHLFAAEALTHLRRTRGLPLLCLGVMTDYTCSPFWEETEMDLYCVPSKDLLGEFLTKGIPGEKLLPTGIPVRRAVHQVHESDTARRALGLPSEGPVALIMGGSMGYGKPERTVRALLARLPPGSAVVVMGGGNEALKARLRREFRCDGRVRVLDFTDRVPEYMAAADVLLTKPGGLTSTEGAVMRVPMVHTPPIPGCESRNARYFASRGMAVSALSGPAIADAAARLWEDAGLRDAMRLCQARGVNPNAAKDICDLLEKTLERRGTHEADRTASAPAGVYKRRRSVRVSAAEMA